MLTREQNDAIFGPSIRVFRLIAPEGLKNLAQGFNPGKHPRKRFALKGREMAWAKCPSNATEKELGIC